MENSRKAFIFYAITLALAVAVVFLVPFLGEASLIVTMMTPTIATVIMLTVIAPEGGLRKVLSLLGLDRAGLKGWPLAIAGPAGNPFGGPCYPFARRTCRLRRSSIDRFHRLYDLQNINGSCSSERCLRWARRSVGAATCCHACFPSALCPAMLIVGFLHGVWHLPLMLTTDYYHNTGNPLLVVPLFLVTLTLAGVFFGFIRIWTGSVWAVAIAHAAANTAWEIMTEMTETKSPLVLEYVGGESGVIMIGGLLIFSFFIIRHMNNEKFKAAMES